MFLTLTTWKQLFSDFGCGIEFMSDAEREQALNFHNQLRSEVALGNVLQYVDYDDYYGPASNMYKLVRSCLVYKMSCRGEVLQKGIDEKLSMLY